MIFSEFDIIQQRGGISVDTKKYEKLLILRDIGKKLKVIYETTGPGDPFSKTPDTFRARKAIEKSRTLRLQSCFIHIF